MRAAWRITMDNQKSILSGSVEDLKRVQVQLKQQDHLDQMIETAHVDKQRLQKDIETEEKLLADNIESTINKRREELTGTFDKEIEKDLNRLKTIRNNREKAKSKGINERIIQETDALSMENRRIHEEIRTVFKQKGIWKRCDSKFFYSLYYARGIGERFISLITWALGLILIPLAGYWLLPWPKWARIILWIGIAAIFISIYIGVRIKTKNLYHSTFKDMRLLRNKIDYNNRMIREIKKKIKNDKNEEHYDLENFDDEIAKLEDSINQVAARKTQALAEFESNSRQVIIQEITNRDKERIESLKNKALALAKNVLELERKSKELKADIMADYGAYLGAEFMSVEKTQILIDIMTESHIQTVHEARVKYLAKI